MERRSSPPEGTTTSTYIDPGANTKEGYEISLRSRTLARGILGNNGAEDRIRQRCSIAVGDFSMAGLIRFRHDPVAAGLEALKRKAPIITDVRMVQIGILKKRHESEIICALDYGDALSMETGITRTSAGYRALGKRLEGSIVAVGNAPSSLLAIYDLIESGIRPALVVGTAVGFVNAAESKELLRTLDIPSISVEGTRGGTPVAVATINELIIMHSEARNADGPGDRV